MSSKDTTGGRLRGFSRDHNRRPGSGTALANGIVADIERA